MTDRRFTVTIFPDAFAQSLSVKETTLAELHEMVVTTAANQKADLPLPEPGLAMRQVNAAERHQADVLKAARHGEHHHCITVSPDRDVSANAADRRS